jgi:hypothetical protein
MCVCGGGGGTAWRCGLLVVPGCPVELPRPCCHLCDPQVVRRPATMVNSEQATGEVEVEVDHLTVLNPCGVLPFSVSALGSCVVSPRSPSPNGLDHTAVPYSPPSCAAALNAIRGS